MRKKWLYLLTNYFLLLFLNSETVFFSSAMDVARSTCHLQLIEALKDNSKINDFRLQPILKAWKASKLPVDEQNFNEQLKSLLSQNMELQEFYQQYTVGLAMEIDQFFQNEIAYLENLNENLSKSLALLQSVPQLQEKHFALVLNSNDISSRKWKRLRKLKLPAKVESRPEFFKTLQQDSDSPVDRETSEFVLKILNSSESGRQLWFQFLQYYYRYLRQAHDLIQKIRELER